LSWNIPVWDETVFLARLLETLLLNKMEAT
jgi:hypothetical protein